MMGSPELTRPAELMSEDGSAVAPVTIIGVELSEPCDPIEDTGAMLIMGAIELESDV